MRDGSGIGSSRSDRTRVSDRGEEEELTDNVRNSDFRGDQGSYYESGSFNSEEGSEDYSASRWSSDSRRWPVDAEAPWSDPLMANDYRNWEEECYQGEWVGAHRVFPESVAQHLVDREASVPVDYDMFASLPLSANGPQSTSFHVISYDVREGAPRIGSMPSPAPFHTWERPISVEADADGRTFMEYPEWYSGCVDKRVCDMNLATTMRHTEELSQKPPTLNPAYSAYPGFLVPGACITAYGMPEDTDPLGASLRNIFVRPDPFRHHGFLGRPAIRGPRVPLYTPWRAWVRPGGLNLPLGHLELRHTVRAIGSHEVLFVADGPTRGKTLCASLHTTTGRVAVVHACSHDRDGKGISSVDSRFGFVASGIGSHVVVSDLGPGYEALLTSSDSGHWNDEMQHRVPPTEPWLVHACRNDALKARGASQRPRSEPIFFRGRKVLHIKEAGGSPYSLVNYVSVESRFPYTDGRNGLHYSSGNFVDDEWFGVGNNNWNTTGAYCYRHENFFALLTASNDRFVTEWTLEGRKRWTVELPWRVNFTTLSPTKKLLCVGGDNEDAVILDYVSLRPAIILEGQCAFIDSISWHPDPNSFLVATGGQDMSCHVWDVRYPKSALFVLGADLHGCADALSVQFAPDGQTLAVLQAKRLVSVYDVASQMQKYSTVEMKAVPTGMSFSPDSNCLFIGCTATESGSKGGIIELRRGCSGVPFYGQELNMFIELTSPLYCRKDKTCPSNKPQENLSIPEDSGTAWPGAIAAYFEAMKEKVLSREERYDPKLSKILATLEQELINKTVFGFTNTLVKSRSSSFIGKRRRASLCSPADLRKLRDVQYLMQEVAKEDLFDLSESLVEILVQWYMPPEAMLDVEFVGSLKNALRFGGRRYRQRSTVPKDAQTFRTIEAMAQNIIGMEEEQLEAAQHIRRPVCSRQMFLGDGNEESSWDDGYESVEEQPFDFSLTAGLNPRIRRRAPRHPVASETPVGVIQQDRRASQSSAAGGEDVSAAASSSTMSPILVYHMWHVERGWMFRSWVESLVKRTLWIGIPQRFMWNPCEYSDAEETPARGEKQFDTWPPTPRHVQRRSFAAGSPVRVQASTEGSLLQSLVPQTLHRHVKTVTQWDPLSVLTRCDTGMRSGIVPPALEKVVCAFLRPS